jgi:hypothetical protein
MPTRLLRTTLRDHAANETQNVQRTKGCMQPGVLDPPAERVIADLGLDDHLHPADQRNVVKSYMQRNLVAIY